MGRVNVIEAEALTKSYGARRGIVELTFSVEPGEVFGFLGPNGAGKTTTIRTLLDLLRPTSGRATVLGFDSHADAVEIHRRVGYLPGEFVAYERSTGREYLEFFARLRDGAPRMNELIQRFDCDVDVKISDLSHGNRQKLGLVQAFMHEPELAILDEPTQGLDPIVQREFHALVQESRKEGRSIFLSSHVLPEVEHLCDRVAIVREGSLIAVEDVGAMKARAIRTVDIRFAGPAPADVFGGLPGVSDIEIQGETLRCKASGSLDALVKAAARFEVIDLRSNEASLEDVFLAFYGKGGEQERSIAADPADLPMKSEVPD
jgi:ABC-2 type transport system ATP-binding protein